MKITKHIPNFITSLNVLCGVGATFYAINGRIEVAIWLIFIGSLFDFLDGFAARAFNAYGEMGKELDSLADLISFGFAPSAIWSCLIKYQLTGSYTSPYFSMELQQKVLVLMPFIMVAFAALRLAKFNVDTRQTENFLGLTTTATGIFTAAFAYKFLEMPVAFEWFKPIFMLLTIALFCMMLISEIPMKSLKIKSLKWKENQERFILLILALVFIALWGLGGIAALIMYYILVSIGKWALGIK